MCEGAGSSAMPRSVAEAMRMARMAAEFLNSPTAADTDGTACGEVLTALAGVRDRLAAANATFLRRFDAADAHDADAHRTSASWLAAKCKMTLPAAKAQVGQMRLLAARPVLHDALITGDLSESWARSAAQWTRELPPEMRHEVDKILVAAAAAGADLRDLATIAGLAVDRWRQSRPDPERDKFDHTGRYVSIGTTIDGAGVIRGDLTPETAAAATAVLESLSKRRGSDDLRSAGQRQHDGLHEAFAMLLRSGLLPDRAGADTQAVVHVPLSDLRKLPGAHELEDEWLRGRIGEGQPGYLDGDDARAAACDALTVPVVTGRADLGVIDEIIALACAAGDPALLSPGARMAHRYAIARLAIDFVSGPGAIASILRTGLLDYPFSSPSLPLDIGISRSIPVHLRRAVIVRSGGHCEWPAGCDTPAAAGDVHHIIHQEDGGPTALWNLGGFCKYHHLIKIHRDGWQIIRHPDAAMEARSPDGKQVLRSHAPPLADTA